MTDINGGLLIRFTPGNSPGSVFEVVHNSVTDFHGTSSSAKENIITDALDNIWLHSLTGQNLFNDMLNSASSVYFTIGITSGSSFSSNGNVFDYKPLGPLGTSLPVFDESGNEIPLAARSNLYGMTLGLGDIVDGTDTNNSLLFDYKLYIGSDGAYHKFTAERVILHELSHSIRNTADISVDETTAITFQNTNTDYQSAAVEFANSVLEFNSTPARAAYLGNFSD